MAKASFVHQKGDKFEAATFGAGISQLFFELEVVGFFAVNCCNTDSGPGLQALAPTSFFGDSSCCNTVGFLAGFSSIESVFSFFG